MNESYNNRNFSLVQLDKNLYKSLRPVIFSLLLTMLVSIDNKSSDNNGSSIEDLRPTFSEKIATTTDDLFIAKLGTYAISTPGEIKEVSGKVYVFENGNKNKLFDVIENLDKNKPWGIFEKDNKQSENEKNTNNTVNNNKKSDNPIAEGISKEKCIKGRESDVKLPDPQKTTGF